MRMFERTSANEMSYSWSNNSSKNYWLDYDFSVYLRNQCAIMLFDSYSEYVF